MSTSTTNYGLIKPAANETADIAVINQNMDTLDTKIKAVETAANADPASNSITDDMIGYRTPDASQVPADPGAGKIGQILSWLANRIAAITGGTHWWDAPIATLAGLNTALNEHQADETQHVPYAVASGSANTYAVTLSPTPTSLVAGMALAVKINVDSTGASTININGLGAKGIKKANGTDVTNLKANGIYTLRYDGTNFTLQGSDAAGNATPADILSGKTATTDAGEITGTIPSKSAQTYTPTTTNQVISAGQYLSGAQTVRGDANLLAANILSGKSIFGVAGNAVDGSGMKKFASGSIPRSSTTVNIREYDNTSSNMYDKYTVTVSGLTFIPSSILVIARTSTYSEATIYQAAGVIKSTMGAMRYISTGDNSYDVADPIYINSTGFCLPVISKSTTYNWYAYA